MPSTNDFTEFVERQVQQKIEQIVQGQENFGEFLDVFADLCPADIVNMKNVKNLINGVIETIKMLLNLEKIAKDIGQAIRDQISVTQEIMDKNSKCPFSVLLGVNVGIGCSQSMVIFYRTRKKTFPMHGNIFHALDLGSSLECQY